MPRTYFPRLGLVAAISSAVVFGMGCTASGAARSPSVVAASSSPATASSHVLTAAELAKAPGPTAYDAIRALRPLYLTTRGPLHGPAVVVDFFGRGTLEDLRHLKIADVSEIRYLPGTAATVQFGAGYTGGVIMVLTRTGRR